MGWFMGVFMLLVFIGTIAFIVLYLKAFYADRNKRQEGAQENILRNGGERVLEWNAPTAVGPADEEFGELLTLIPAKFGEGAKFYRLGCTVGNKRIPYLNIKDILVQEDQPSGGLNTLRNTMRDSGKMWIYQHKGATVGLNVLTHNLDTEVALAIKQGLGF